MNDFFKDLLEKQQARLKLVSICFVVSLLSLVSGAYKHQLGDGLAVLLESTGGMILFAPVACTVLIVLAKLILTPILQRSEDYYFANDDIEQDMKEFLQEEENKTHEGVCHHV